MPKLIFLSSLLLLTFLWGAAQQTKILTADKHNEYGLVYSLPVTAMQVEVTATRTVQKAGPYYQYARKFLGTDRVVKMDDEKWVITSVNVVPYGVPDRENQYLMQLKPGSATFIGVDADGMLLSINAAPTQVEVPVPEARRMSGTPTFNDREYLQYVNEDFIASQSSAKQAQMLAESLMEIREAKIALTRGTAETMPTDGRQLELMLQSLEHQEQAITQAFTGFVFTETVSRTYSFTPEDEGKVVLFRMSDFAGFVEPDDYSGKPVYLSVDMVSEGTLPVDAKGEEKKFPKDGVAYCIPGTAKVKITLDRETLWEKTNEFAQFGVIFGLNPTLFSSKKEQSYAIFDPVTGALKEIGNVEQ